MSDKWQIEVTTRFLRDKDWYVKKRPREIAAALNNLTRYLLQLNSARNSRCVQAGYLHSEKRGVLAIDQRPSRDSEETRLYIYADDKTKTVYLITIGNKRDQANDIKLAHRFVDSLSR